MKNFRFTRILLIAMIVIGLVYAVCPAYLRKALIYQTADIDDYQIFTNRTVIAGAWQPWEESAAMNQRQLDPDIRSEMEAYKPVAFLVIRDARIQYEEYWDDYSSSSLSNSFSMAKSIVSLLVGIALEDGFIDSVDDPVGKYLPEFMEGRKSAVTIRHLLEMSSGLSWDEAYASPFSMTTKGYYGEDLSGLVLAQEVDYEPGMTFEYKSGNTQLLALILEAATRESVSAYASQKLWQPMGAQHDALWSLDREKGVEKAYCCFNSNARDFARFGQLMLNVGSWKGRQLVPTAYLEQALQPVTHLTDGEGRSVDYYGWQFWLLDYQGYAVQYMRGVNGQYIFVIPDLDLVIVRLGHERSKERTQGTPNDVFVYLKAGLSLIQ